MVMKKLGPLLLVTCSLIACSVEGSHPPMPAPPPAQTASAPISVRSQPTSASDSLDAAEAAAINAADRNVSRLGSELRIHLLDGRNAVFKDDTTPGQFALPRYAGYLKTIHSHVVHRIPYEGSGAYWVIDDLTGDSTIVFGMPVVSPDSTRFAITSMSGETDYDPSLLEIWRMVGRKPEREFSHDSGEDSWDPSDAVWRDSVTVDFIKNSRIPPYPTSRGRLVRTGATWALSESAR